MDYRRKTIRRSFIILFLLLIHIESLDAASLNYGIFQTVHYRTRVSNPTLNIENPYLAGVQFTFNWAEIEPEEGNFHWELIDSVIEPWAQRDKKVILSLRTVLKRGANPTQSSATPTWVYDAGADKIEFDGTNYPLYWDPVFLEKYERFISAVAKRYDNNPDIAFVEMGIGLFGTTKISHNHRLRKQYENHGYTEELWSQTILNIIDIYKKYFVEKNLVLTLSPFYGYKKFGHGDGSEIFLRSIAEYAAAHGVYLYNHSLSGTQRFANNPFLPWYGEFHENTKIILGPDNPVIKNQQKYGNIEDVTDYAFGDLYVETDEGIKYIPKTYTSFLIFYPQDISATSPENPSFDKVHQDAIQKALKRLGLEHTETSTAPLL
jgi:hypothetical protein